MSNIVIESVRMSYGQNIFPCDPGSTPLIAEAEVTVDEQQRYVSVVDVKGLPKFYVTEESTLDRQAKDTGMDDDFTMYMIRRAQKYDTYTAACEDSDAAMQPVYIYLDRIMHMDAEAQETYKNCAIHQPADELIASR